MKPLIGITIDVAHDPEDARSGGKLSLNYNYAQVVADAGGVPVLIPPQADPVALSEVLDGLLIPGGNDIDACNWGEANHPEAKTIAQERFDVEKKLFTTVDPKMPVLGICYGCQFINVMRGGSMIQHLPDVVDETHTGGENQKYQIEKGSKLSNIFGKEAQGQSWHHQAIKDVGHDLKVVAKSEDGVIEAIEADDRPWLVGVQWHPERTFDDPATRKLFENFIAAASDYQAKRTNAVGVW